MTTDSDLEERIRKSIRVLSAWNWMGALSTRQSEAISILREEARYLIQLGVKHPEQAQRIGKIIVAYQRLIRAIELRMDAQSDAA